MTLKPKYQRGEIVYLKTDPDQYPHIVTGFILRTELIYELSCGHATSEHYAFEISKNQNVVLKTSSAN